jgi:hypothetical protein
MNNTTQTTGGASFPPLNPGSSWNVPRVSLPGLFAMQPEFQQEWWYYVGTVYTTSGMIFSLQVQIVRETVVSPISIGYSITGIGWKDEAGESNYIFGQGIGLGASESSSWLSELSSLIVSPVSDIAFSARMTPLIEIIGQSENLWSDMKLDVFSSHKTNFEYLGGNPVGSIGSTYSISAKGSGYKTLANEATTLKSDYHISLTLEDKRGTVMEGVSGYVGPYMFVPVNNPDAPPSYECAQPFLTITAGTIEIEDVIHTIEKGNLWMDRQMVSASENNSSQQSVSLKHAEDLKNYFLTKTTSSKPLYLGDWMAVTLDNGLSLALVEFWQPCIPPLLQWQTGTKVYLPPQKGFGNLFFSVEPSLEPFVKPVHNGGIALRPRYWLEEADDMWDFDINILNAEDPDPDQSPHWKSPISGQTYATAWEIEFSKSIQHYGLPEKLYVFVLCENCENVLPGKTLAFFEGTAIAYADKEKTKPLGHVFVEQMGFN